MKFSPGDPVWVRIRNGFSNRPDKPNLPLGEVPGMIVGISKRHKHAAGHIVYDIDIPQGAIWAIEPILRPRRDDYQQHESLGSKEKLTTSNQDLIEDSIEQLCEEIIATQH